MTTLTRRRLLLTGGALAVAAATPARAALDRSIHVRLDPNCECCTGWTAHLREAGFAVTEEEMHAGLLAVWKVEAGVPHRLISCHTGEAGGYVIEGHVPAADIDRLLLKRPDARGLAVPGMPYGSPGMGPETERDAYDVVLFRADGSTEIWAAYPAA
jgi:hypothetical protein